MTFLGCFNAQHKFILEEQVKTRINEQPMIIRKFSALLRKLLKTKKFKLLITFIKNK